jgi:hypothetical protein
MADMGVLDHVAASRASPAVATAFAAGRDRAEHAALCKVSRLSLAYFLSYLEQLRPGFGQDVVKGLVFVAIVQANIGHLENDGSGSRSWADLAAVPPDELRRPIRVLPLADSLRLPRETVRRKVRALAADRFVEATEDGVVAPTRVLSRPGNGRSLQINTAAVRELVEGLLEAEVLGPAPAVQVLHSRHRLIARISADYCLRCLEQVREVFDGQVVTGLVFLAMLHAGRQRPFDGAGRPLTVQALAKAVALPRQTVRRHVQRLIDRGLASPCAGGGFAAIGDPLTHPALLAAARRNESDVRWLLGQLRRAGALQLDV